ncbi:hypothetical protein [Rhizobium sullae]|uniref:hypothetical protein n=1 Tax=Rhizobium sullae TaxID=50338 RepID=UPI0015C5EE20|nr:hypothetical protein [Rhizobium sullae]
MKQPDSLIIAHHFPRQPAHLVAGRPGFFDDGFECGIFLEERAEPQRALVGFRMRKALQKEGSQRRIKAYGPLLVSFIPVVISTISGPACRNAGGGGSSPAWREEVHLKLLFGNSTRSGFAFIRANISLIKGVLVRADVEAGLRAEGLLKAEGPHAPLQQSKAAQPPIAPYLI